MKVSNESDPAVLGRHAWALGPQQIIVSAFIVGSFLLAGAFHWFVASTFVEQEYLAATMAPENSQPVSEFVAELRSNRGQFQAAGWVFCALSVIGFLIVQDRMNRRLGRLDDLKNRLDRISDHIPGMIYQYRFNPESGARSFPYASESIREIYGVAPDDVVEDASVVFSRLHPDDRKAVEDSIEESARTMRPWHHEYRVCLPNGRVEWREGFSTPERMVDGSIIWSGYINNVTMSKEREALYRDAQTKFEASEGAFDELRTKIIEEIRFPMNGLIGLSSLFRNTDPMPEHVEIVETILGSSNELLNLVSEDEGLEDKQLIVAEKRFDLLELIGKIRGIGECFSGVRSIDFVTICSRELPSYCVGDDARIAQIVINLIANSVEFSSDKSRVEFHVDLVRKDSKYATIRFQVIDHGIGFSAAEQERVFDYSADSLKLADQRYEGTAMGLAMASKLSDMMDATLSCLSKEGVGTKFEFELTLNLAEKPVSEDNDLPSASSELPENIEVGKANLNILVVDDNPSNLHVAVMMLEQMGYLPACAENGQEAISACESEEFDLVIMDLEMPVMDGIRATAEIHERIPQNRRPRIVALTANATDIQREVCFEIGMDDFMAKPIRMNRLREIVATSARSKTRAIAI